MAANKFSSLLLFSLMVSTFILLPMASGQIRICPVRRPLVRSAKDVYKTVEN
ncbi:hypothetical protein HID58_095600 [Brassica napus]|uniref:Uncharacterized protein n=1 Tax=Brassica napus TaxID=3708 RepID=A0ABQ7X333_BRANA|nr:hypothetical protein HID58_095600 [Brassica napus]